MSRFEMIMTPSMASAEHIVNTGHDAYILHHGVDHAIFHPGTRDTSDFLFGTVKINNFKAQLGRLMSAYNNMCRETQSKLLIHSNPIDSRGAPLKDMAQTYDIEDYIRFSQPALCNIGLPDHLMGQFYRNLSVYVSTSGGDTVNLPALEASACGIPVITTDVPGPAEYLGESAYYVPSIEGYPSGFGNVRLADQSKLSEALLEYYTNEDLRIEKGKLAFEYSKQWPWERAVDELKKNLSELM
jgi:glycosyltransferase involved in cell wall biosynthesis